MHYKKQQRKIMIEAYLKVIRKTHKYITLFVFESHFTPFQLHGSGSSGLHWRRTPSELTTAVLKLSSASPTNHKGAFTH